MPAINSPNSPIGIIDLRAYDRGIVEYTLGGEVINITVDQSERPAYAVKVRGLDTNIDQFEGKVPIYFTIPEDVYSKWKLPCFVVRRNDLTPNFQRCPWYGWQRAPTADAEKIYAVNPMNPRQSVQGWSQYVDRRIPFPFDIGYDIVVMARRQGPGLLMLQHALEICTPPYFSMACYDNLGDRRLYDSGEVQVSTTSELADIADRTIAWTISFQVQGELDLRGDVEDTAGDALIDQFPDVYVAGKPIPDKG